MYWGEREMMMMGKYFHFMIAKGKSVTGFGKLTGNLRFLKKKIHFFYFLKLNKMNFDSFQEFFQSLKMGN